jgi:hypothetical protein
VVRSDQVECLPGYAYVEFGFELGGNWEKCTEWRPILVFFWGFSLRNLKKFENLEGVGEFFELVYKIKLMAKRTLKTIQISLF